VLLSCSRHPSPQLASGGFTPWKKIQEMSNPTQMMKPKREMA
jgi:hypothetical protein